MPDDAAEYELSVTKAGVAILSVKWVSEPPQEARDIRWALDSLMRRVKGDEDASQVREATQVHGRRPRQEAGGQADADRNE